MEATSLAAIVEQAFDDCLDEASILDQTHVRYIFWFCYIVVFLACLFGNLFTLIVLCVHPTMRTPTNFFLANLAVADFLVASFCILQNMLLIVGFENAQWPLGELLCKMYLYVLQVVPCVSVGILMCVSIEKYVAVLHPLIALKMLTRRLRITCTVVVWSVSLLANIPYFRTAKLFAFGSCSRNSDNLEVLVTMSFAIWYLVPVVTMAYIYTKIGLVLWKSGHGIHTHASTDSQSNAPAASWQISSGRIILYQQNSLLQVPDANSRPQIERRREVRESRRKVIRLLFVIVASFAALTLPHHARQLHSTFSSAPTCIGHWSLLLQPLAFLLLFLSSAINPILYAFLSRKFRLAAKDVLQCRWRLLCASEDERSRGRTMNSSFDEDAETSRAASRSASFSFVHSVRIPLLVATIVGADEIDASARRLRRPAHVTFAPEDLEAQTSLIEQ